LAAGTLLFFGTLLFRVMPQSYQDNTFRIIARDAFLGYLVAYDDEVAEFAIHSIVGGRCGVRLTFGAGSEGQDSVHMLRQQRFDENISGVNSPDVTLPLWCVVLLQPNFILLQRWRKLRASGIVRACEP
jgi:hypothetical protein